MRNIVITSDRYNFLLEGYIKLFNKYWRGDYIHTTIIGFDIPDINLGEGFDFYSMGKQSNYLMWTTPLIKFFESIDDEYFLLSFEDHYLINEVDMDVLIEGIELLKNDDVDKLYLHKDYTNKANNHYSGNWYSCSDSSSTLHTTSLMPSIWKREFLLKLLNNSEIKGGKDPHQFERLNNESAPLGCNVLITKDFTVYPNLDAARKNKFNTSVINRYDRDGSGGPFDFAQNLTEEDVNIFRDMQQIAINNNWKHYKR